MSSGEAAKNVQGSSLEENQVEELSRIGVGSS